MHYRNQTACHRIAHTSPTLNRFLTLTVSLLGTLMRVTRAGWSFSSGVQYVMTLSEGDHLLRIGRCVCVHKCRIAGCRVEMPISQVGNDAASVLSVRRCWHLGNYVKAVTQSPNRQPQPRPSQNGTSITHTAPDASYVQLSPQSCPTHVQDELVTDFSSKVAHTQSP